MKGPLLEGLLYYLKNSLTPLPFLFWRLISTLNANTPELFRLINLILHAANTYILFKIAKIFFEKPKDDTKGFEASWFIALFYLFHPTQVEAVIWVSSLRTLMATFFALLSVYLLLEESLTKTFEEGQKNQSKDSFKRFAPAWGCYFLSLLSNPTTAPSFLFAYTLIFLKKGRLSRELLTFALFFLIGATVIFFSHEREVLTTYYGDLPWTLRVKIIITAVSSYILNLIFPFNLTFDYQINPLSISYLEETSQLSALLTLGPFAILTCVALTLKERTRTMGLLLGAFFMCLTPHSGIILHDFNNISVVSDRYLNFPLAPYALFVGAFTQNVLSWAKKRFERLSPWFPITFIWLLLPCISLVQIYKWKEPKNLLKSSQNLLELREPMLVALGNDYAREENFNQARASFKEALAASPNSPSALKSFLFLNQEHPSKESDQFLVEYLFNNPMPPTRDSIILLANLYLREHQFKLALNLINQGLLLKVSEKEHKKLLQMKNKIASFREDFAIAALKDLESYYASEGNYKKAIHYLEELKEIDPYQKEYFEDKLKNYRKESISGPDKR